MSIALFCMLGFRVMGLLTAGTAPLLPMKESAYRLSSATISLTVSVLLFLFLFAILAFGSDAPATQHGVAVSNCSGGGLARVRGGHGVVALGSIWRHPYE